VADVQAQDFCEGLIFREDTNIPLLRSGKNSIHFYKYSAPTEREKFNTTDKYYAPTEREKFNTTDKYYAPTEREKFDTTDKYYAPKERHASN
jgi:hypothetical protein